MTINTTFANVNKQLKDLLESLVDKDDNPYFESVLLGIPNSNFRGFRFPIAIVRTVRGDYKTETFNKKNTPEWIHSTIGILVTGDVQESYEFLIDLIDVIQDKWEHDDTWIKLNDTVRLTEIESTEILDVPSDETIIRMAVFSLRHHIYK